MPDADISLLEKYCPLVYLHRKEPVRPISVEDFIARSNLVGGCWQFSEDPGPVTGAVEDVPFYGKVDYTSDGSLSLLYMFFYHYNAPYHILGCYPAGAHPGDLEHVRVTVNRTNELVSTVTFGQHSNQIVVSSDALQYHTVTRPVIYSACGSHASYPAGGIKPRWNTALLACDACGKGWRWNESAIVRPWPRELLDSSAKLGVTDNAPRQWWWNP